MISFKSEVVKKSPGATQISMPIQIVTEISTSLSQLSEEEQEVTCKTVEICFSDYDKVCIFLFNSKLNLNN